MILACGTTVAATLRSKGYRALARGALPTDTCAFAPDTDRREAVRRELDIPQDARWCSTPEAGGGEGIRTLWRAFEEVAGEQENVYLVVAGGPLKAEIEEERERQGLLRECACGCGAQHRATGMMNAAEFCAASETRDNWREQFGRVAWKRWPLPCPNRLRLGRDSNVLGDDGFIFPEGDSMAWRPPAPPRRDPSYAPSLAVGAGRAR